MCLRVCVCARMAATPYLYVCARMCKESRATSSAASEVVSTRKPRLVRSGRGSFGARCFNDFILSAGRSRVNVFLFLVVRRPFRLNRILAAVLRRQSRPRASVELSGTKFVSESIRDAIGASRRRRSTASGVAFKKKAPSYVII